MASKEAQIEELKARVRGLEGERERLSWLFEAMPVGVLVMDEHGNIKDFSSQLAKIVGYRHAILADGSLARLIVQSDIPVFLDHLRRCKMSQRLITSEIRLRNGTPDGLPVELVSLPPSNHADPVLYRTAVVDLSKHRATQQKLTDAVEKFATLLDTVEGIVWELDGESLNVTFVSRYAEKMLGYPLSHWFQEGFWERHIHVDDRERVMQEVVHALQERTNVTVDYRVFTSDRRVMWIHDRMGARSHGGKIKLLGIAVDITGQKDIEEELEKERSNLERRVAERTAQLQTTKIENKIRIKDKKKKKRKKK